MKKIIFSFLFISQILLCSCSRDSDVSIKVAQNREKDITNISSNRKLQIPINKPIVGGKSGNMMHHGLADSDNEKIIYSWENKIISINLNGSGRTVISNDNAQCICILDNWVYYRKIGLASDPINGIYKMRKDGTEVTQITSDTTQYLYVVGDWIYYNNWSYTTDICRIRIDGTCRETLYSGQYDCLSTDGTNLYFSDFGKSIYIKAPMNGGTYEVILKSVGGMPQLSGDWIYYIDGTTYEFNRVKKDGTHNEKCSLEYPFKFITNDNFLYVETKRQDIKSGETITWTKENFNKIQLVGDQLLLWKHDYDKENPRKIKSVSLILKSDKGKEVILEHKGFD